MFFAKHSDKNINFVHYYYSNTTKKMKAILSIFLLVAVTHSLSVFEGKKVSYYLFTIVRKASKPVML